VTTKLNLPSLTILHITPTRDRIKDGKMELCALELFDEESPITDGATQKRSSLEQPGRSYSKRALNRDPYLP